MTPLKVFVSQAWPDRADTAWARGFADALRSHGFDVTEAWDAHDEAARAAVEQGLRQSDVIVSLTDPDGTESPTFYFELGVAAFGNKEFVAVLPEGVQLARLPVHIRQGQSLVQTSPTSTAAALVDRYAARRTA